MFAPDNFIIAAMCKLIKLQNMEYKIHSVSDSMGYLRLGTNRGISLERTTARTTRNRHGTVSRISE